MEQQTEKLQALTSAIEGAGVIQECSAQLDKLFEAISQFQGKMADVKIDLNAKVDYQPKDRSKPPVKYKYATLDHILSLVTPHLAACGLGVVQLPIADKLRTVLTHSSGQYISCVMNLPISGRDQKEQGSWITYLRRYSLCAILGISGTEDKDAEPTEGKEGEAATMQVFDADAWDLRKREIQHSVNAGMEPTKVLAKLMERGFIVEEKVIAEIIALKPDKKSDAYKKYQERIAAAGDSEPKK